jgi:hypothetical protein
MSSTKINNFNNKSNKPYCKVCHDAGKSEQLYTNHYVKDRSGATICPTLLAQECRYCFKKGHTTKFCQVLKAKQEGKTVEPEKPKYVKPIAPVSKPASVFAYLDFSSDDEEEEKEKEIVEDKEAAFPALTTITVVQSEPKAPGKFSYASMAAKTEVDYKIEQYTEKKQVAPILQQAKLSIPIQPFKSKFQTKINWDTAESDSEGDEEEEYNAYKAKKAPQVVEDNSAW